METLRNMIVAFMNLEQNQHTWDERLHEFQLAYNSSVHDSTKLSPFSVVHGREARLMATPDFSKWSDWKTLKVKQGQLYNITNIAQCPNSKKINLFSWTFQ
ncbi:hypothetical protein G6F61_011924 [Rhizopus arrhizus]|nr:hypothetical protein G6F42_013518 [Rhizopus arrhizus]KAG1370569.1 hypothetical protein G6F61_011924 [Rhizopus arrhizus]